MRAGKDAILADVHEGRVRGFIDTAILDRDFDTMEPSMIWRIHQVARWMARFDLHSPAATAPRTEKAPLATGMALC
jgi:hypothetical protein